MRAIPPCRWSAKREPISKLVASAVSTASFIPRVEIFLKSDRAVNETLTVSGHSGVRHPPRRILDISQS